MGSDILLLFDLKIFPFLPIYLQEGNKNGGGQYLLDDISTLPLIMIIVTTLLLMLPHCHMASVFQDSVMAFTLRVSVTASVMTHRR